MALSRAVAGFLSTTITPCSARRILIPSALQVAANFSSASSKCSPKGKPKGKPKTEAEGFAPNEDMKPALSRVVQPRRPPEIPFRPMLANCVHLVGTISVPVEPTELQDGSAIAVSVLLQDNLTSTGFPQFSIPIIFKDDWAHAAVAYLKENDYVYITGQLCGHVSPVKSQDESGIEVVVRNFGIVPMRNGGRENLVVEGVTKGLEDSPSSLQLWNDLFANPINWEDNRSNMDNKMSPAFENKINGQLLWIDESTPDWVLRTLAVLPAPCKPSKEGSRTTKTAEEQRNFNAAKELPISKTAEGPQNSKIAPAPRNSKIDLWNDLIANPLQWRDNRKGKANGMRHPRYPDFSSIATGDALWLDSAPQLVANKLDSLTFGPSREGMEFRECQIDKPSKYTHYEGTETFASSKEKCSGLPSRNEGTQFNMRKEELWNSVVKNPSQWWDYRLAKQQRTVNIRYPDFKHKETNTALWIDRHMPQSIVSQLPPVEARQA